MELAVTGPFLTAAVTVDRIRVLLADDHPMLREGVAAVLRNQPDMEVVGEASDGMEAVEGFLRLQPDVTLMDLQMPRMDGVEAIARIRAESPQARVIVLTTYAGDVKALRALRAGASGYLLKSTIRNDLVEAIRAVHGGGRHLPPDVATSIALHAVGEALSEREVAILTLVAGGNANKQIAWKLSMSEDTVKTHMKSIFTKLGVSDRTHAVTVAARRGIIDL
jgi:DNA-binding NarL/FixJ family response regulator